MYGMVLLQVPRILNPVVLVVDSLPDLCKDQQVKGYVESLFGSVEQCRQVGAIQCCNIVHHHCLRAKYGGCRKYILADFFKHAFDGGGADNFFDAGSCIGMASCVPASGTYLLLLRVCTPSCTSSCTPSFIQTAKVWHVVLVIVQILVCALQMDA